MYYIYLAEEPPLEFKQSVRYVTVMKPYEIRRWENDSIIFHTKGSVENSYRIHYALIRDSWWRTFEYPLPEGVEPDDSLKMMLMLYPEQFKE